MNGALGSNFAILGVIDEAAVTPIPAAAAAALSGEDAVLAVDSGLAMAETAFATGFATGAACCGDLGSSF